MILGVDKTSSPHSKRLTNKGQTWSKCKVYAEEKEVKNVENVDKNKQAHLNCVIFLPHVLYFSHTTEVSTPQRGFSLVHPRAELPYRDLEEKWKWRNEEGGEGCIKLSP